MGIFWIVMASVGLVFVVSDIVFGYVMKLYDRTKWFDLMMHFVSGSMLFVPIGYVTTILLGSTKWSATLFAFFFAVGLAAIWEVIEFTIDSIFKTNMQRWKDYNHPARRVGLIDSAGDIVATIVGAMLACAILAILIATKVM